MRRGGRNPHDGHNVVFHEFAHKLDQLDGVFDGVPPLGGDAARACLSLIALGRTFRGARS